MGLPNDGPDPLRGGEVSSGEQSAVKLGRYEIVRELGKGAMGVVYLAKDPVIGRMVALKTIRIAQNAEDDETREFQQRFVREAQAAGVLNHPAIVTVYELGSDDITGTSFIAMEFVEGHNLREVLQQGRPLTFEQIGDIVAQIADGLDFAHAKGIVHRDVKPANIILLEGLRAKITDFGIAKIASGAANLTSTGQFLGTPNYMAPEQIKGAPVDGRTDIFALGVCLYECLTRRKPFGGDSLTAISYKIVHEPFPPVQEINPQIPIGYEDVIGKCLAKDPARRFQRAREVAAAIRAVNKGEQPILESSESEATIITRSDRSAADAGHPDGAITSPGTAAATAQGGRHASAPPVTEQIKRAVDKVHSLPVLGIRIPAIAFILIVLALLGGLGYTVTTLKKRVPPDPHVDTAAEAQAAQQKELRVQANRLLAAGNITAAYEKLQQLSKLAPNSPAVNSLLQQINAARANANVMGQQVRLANQKYEAGMQLFNEGDYEKAVPILREAFSINPSSDEIAQALQSAIDAQAQLDREKGPAPKRGGDADDGLTNPTAPPAPASSAGRPVTRPAAAAPGVSASGPTQLAMTFNSPWADGFIEVQVGGQSLIKEYLWEEIGKMMFRRRKGRSISITKSFAPGPYDVEISVIVPAENIQSHKLFQRVVFVPGSSHHISVTADPASKRIDYRFN